MFERGFFDSIYLILNLLLKTWLHKHVVPVHTSLVKSFRFEKTNITIHQPSLELK